MRLAHFSANRPVMPHVALDGRPASADFTAGQHGVEWIDCNAAGTCIIVRRSRLPDIVFTAMGYGTFEGDGEVPGNRSGNPVEEEKGKKK